ncbi:MAG: MMPL family transporter [Treponemataceae bacterium]|nr:MMPL family transporter [Treponemataceae bacterium]
MKKPFLPRNSLTPKTWLFCHGALLLALLLSFFFARPPRFNTSLLDILPPSHSLKNVGQADAALSANTSRAATILAYAEDFSAAKSAAAYLYEHAPYFDEATLYVDATATEGLTDFLFANRFNLLDAQTVAQLENGGAESFAQDALARIYGAFSLTDSTLLADDPFDLTGTTLLRFLRAAQNGGAMAVKDGVLAAEHDGVWYVMLRGSFSPAALSLAGKNSAVKELYAQCRFLTQTTGVRFAFSGVPFHSYESSSQAQRQVSVISTIGIVLVVLLFLAIFRSPLPAIVSAAAVVLSCGIGLAAVLLFFRQIHILTFVFGTTLIGTCVDYSIHFFVHWKGDAAVRDGAEIRQKILRGVGISFLSTEICFAALFLSPFPFLQQVAAFLFFGLLCAFLTVTCLFPYLPLPPAETRTIPLLRTSSALRLNAPLLAAFRFLPLVLTMGAVAVLAHNRSSVKIDNNLRDMYTMSDHLLESEKITAQVLDYGSAGWYFLIEGETAQDVLQTEETFTALLAQAQADGKLHSYLATSDFVPSRARQERSYAACAQLLPLAAAQYDALGFSDDGTEAAAFAAEYESRARQFVLPDQADMPAILQSVTKSLWIGAIDGRWYSCVLPLHTDDEAFFRALATSVPGVYFVNKTADIGAELNALTAMMLKLLAAAFAVVLVLLCFCYPPKTVACITAIPVITVLVTFAALCLSRISIGFFSVTGVVLVFGLGLDYVIYAIEGKKSDGALNSLAILVSFVTTALSFGALALINFAPVHTIGLTVFVGLTTACVSAFAIAKSA